MQTENTFFRRWVGAALRRRVPYFGHEDSYFLGSGTAGASGSRQGEWSFVIGPDYTGPNMITTEQFSIDGAAIPFEMYRLRGSGCFFGMGKAGTLVCTLTDAVLPENGEDTHRAQLLRYLTVENTGLQPVYTALKLRLVTPHSCRCEQNRATVTAPKGSWCFGNQETKTPKDHFLFVTVPSPMVTLATDGGQGYTGITFTLPLGLAPGEAVTLPVWHTLADTDTAPALPQAEAFLPRALTEWQAWLDSGSYPKAIRDRRLADATEALLLCVKTEQNRDGGMIAGIRKYANSYIRDTHGGMRLLLAAGHTREVAKLLTNIHTRWQKVGFIPNWWSMGSDAFIGDSFHNNAAEVTAYYLFMARDYLKACGGDAPSAALVQQILPSLRWAAQAQRQWLADHGNLMDFNGDETEQYTNTADGQEYGLFGHFGAKDEMGFTMSAASFASTAAAVASLRWFGDYTGEEVYAKAADAAAAAIDTAFWQPQKGSHSWLADQNGPRDTRVTNFLLLPLWIGAQLNGDRQKADALAALALRDEVTGFWPNCPGCVEGFCGHTPGLALYAALTVAPEKAPDLADQILNTHLLSCYGTVSEFYGPGGVPNGHNARPFEGGIVGEALIKYAAQFGR